MGRVCSGEGVQWGGCAVERVSSGEGCMGGCAGGCAMRRVCSGEGVQWGVHVIGSILRMD